MDVFVQVNTSYEESKFGLATNQTEKFIRSLQPYHSLKIKDLMTIGLLDIEPQRMRPSLALLRQTRDFVLNQGIDKLDELKLSMGMTQDFEIAIAEGSNMVRIGTAIFGNRFLGKKIWNESEAE